MEQVVEIKVLFVCLGNICRSPMAEGAFKELVRKNKYKKKYYCDSAGTSAYHIGEQPDRRMMETAFQNGITLSHAAQQVTEEDFDFFDWVVAMDRNNYNDLNEKKKHHQKAKVVLMREFDEERGSLDVPDPYYGGVQGFQEVFEIVMRSCSNFLEHLEKEG